MSEYHKIQSLYKRDEKTKKFTLEFSLPEFEYLYSNEWVFTEKVDGTNIRIIILTTGEFEIRGKTDNAQLPAELFQTLSQHFTPRKQQLARKFPTGVVLYGEGYGPKIQSGGNYRSDQAFVLFDANIDGWWLKRSAVEDIAVDLELDVVPVIGKGTLGEMELQVRSMFRSQWGDFFAEGIVARPAIDLFTRSGERIIVKLKHKDF